MKSYSEKELRRVLGKELEVSEYVNTQLQSVYGQIRSAAAVQKKSKSRGFRIKYIQAAAAAVASVSALTVCAASYLGWNNRLTEKMQIQEEQQKELEDSGIASFPGVSCTDANVTVTALQCITDRYYSYLDFRVDGYSLPEGSEPCFDKISVTVDGSDEFSWDGSFYNGIITGADGKAVYAEGGELQYDDEGVAVRQFEAEDGSLEFHMTLANPEQPDLFIGKPIHVELENLGTVAQSEVTVDVNGKWVLDWTLGGADTTQDYEISEPLGDTGATVKSVELSPVSIRVLYDFPRTGHTEEADLDNGTTAEVTFYDEAPRPIGVKLKDGSLALYIDGGPGMAGFVDDTSNDYAYSFAFDRVINTEEVEAILFLKDYPEGEEPITEENCYAVAL